MSIVREENIYTLYVLDWVPQKQALRWDLYKNDSLGSAPGKNS